eukprot:763746-Hanusia_phi.AAC.3
MSRLLGEVQESQAEQQTQAGNGEELDEDNDELIRRMGQEHEEQEGYWYEFVEDRLLPTQRPTRAKPQEVERPLDYWIRSLSFDKPSQLREHMNSMGWPDRVLARHWEFGFSAKDLMNIFVSLPPYLQKVTRRALHAVEIIVADRMEKQAQALQGKLLMGSETVTEEALELERSFYQQQSFGMIKQHLHPDTGKRAHVYISDTMCRIVGLHAEEALARIANRELPLPITEFCFLCYVMFGTLSFITRPGLPLSLFSRIRDLGERGGPDGVMLRIDQQQEYGSDGRLIAMKTYFVPLDQESFDASLAEVPADSLSAKFCRHLCAGRDYKTLKSDLEADMFAVRSRSSRELLADWEVTGGDDLGDAEVEARDGAPGGAGEGCGGNVSAVGRACGEDAAGEEVEGRSYAMMPP